MPDGTPGGKGSNLHRLWDSGLLNTAGLDDATYLAQLRALPLAVPVGTDAAAWAEASCDIVVRPGLYPVAGALIDDRYVSAWRPVAEAQLRRGGANLAALLNGTLGG